MTIAISPLTTELKENAVAFITDLVEDLMTAGEPFTSLDIANEAKKAGHFARNRWVAQWMRSNVIEISHQLSALYNQTLIEVDSAIDGPTWAYLYHHMHFDPADYQDRDQQPLQTVGQGRTAPQPAVSVRAIKIDVPDGTPAPVVDQHIAAVTGATGAQVTAVPKTSAAPSVTAPTAKTGVVPQRDSYGRFISNPADQKPAPTHFLRQKRVHGRFAK